MDWDSLFFSTAALIAGVFVLDYGADKFIDHTVIVGQRLGISPTLIALLTAGAEYEELAVVIAAILQGRTPLALGNVMGSAISNILGAFSLGLVCYPGGDPFDSSAKIYSALQFFVTTLVVILAYFQQLNRVTGGLLIALFALYIISIGYAIYRGISEPPQLSDSESDDESTDVCAEQTPVQSAGPPALETSPLLGDTNRETASASVNKGKKLPRPLYHHVLQLIFGLLTLSLSGYILAHSAGTIADCLHLSGTVFGLTVIAFATTLPEKLIAMLSGFRGQGGIIVATTAGSNIFLLTLCVGIVAVAGSLDRSDTFVLFDLVTVWVSSVSLLAVVFLGPHRIAGLVLLAAYVIFLVMEFTVYRR
ncbi:Sodium/calcium exchanger membrane region [Penicillium griseofulvum]|uniref:Sodium/calcium exchanger membrane region n=1 Tax=Penicillium patulum TaxID=5078 RepID=A0A135L945_PENPA|nr:Sodium/calcium exchanger membrane region [Penicillium griseofulvum]KXG45487.1 Sodium/calcium exchanger membrane region [Penicillium griseofulvum]